MQKILTKSLFFLPALILFAQFSLAQVINVGNVDPGPYGPGSTIAVPFQVSSGCLDTKNVYNIYLSDASGSFTSSKLIGEMAGFYATFANGVIPAGIAAGTGYRIKIVSTSPAVSSNPSAAFAISGSTGVAAGLNSQAIDPGSPQVFGSCSGGNTTPYNFINTSTAGSVVTATFFNEQTQTAEQTNIDLTGNGSFTAKSSNYTIIAKAVKDGIAGTYGYTLVNNANNNGFGVEGSKTACLGSGVTLNYTVDLALTKNNYPGLIYYVSWGDGTPAVSYTYCQLTAVNGVISHNYLKASCGNNVKGQNNSFEVLLQLASPHCGSVGTPVASYAKVISPPVNLPVIPVAACLGTPVKMTNNSFPGDDPNSTSISCVNTKASYTWLVDGQVKAVNYKLSDEFDYTFTTTGTHQVTLRLQNNTGSCPVADVTENICVQNPPVPKFDIQATACGPVSVTPVNTSTIDANCNASNTYIWKVTGPAAVTFGNGTNSASGVPQFNFTAPGIYTVTLGIQTLSCGLITAPAKTIIISTAPTAQLSPDFTVCTNTGQILSFDPGQTTTKTILTGTPNPQPDTYTWTITGGGAYSFVSPSTASSQYPVIKFDDMGIYTVNVVHKNSCGADAVASQHITFQKSPDVSAGTYSPVCSGSMVSLAGTISDLTTVSSIRWTGGTGTFSAPGALISNYTPSAAEIAAGTVTLALNVTTNLPAPCNEITSITTISIIQPNTITSAAAVSVCSGSAVNYKILSAWPASNFLWTVDAAQTSLNASGYALSGSGQAINDVIADNDPLHSVKVTYIITPEGGICNGTPFNLTVTVMPVKAAAGFTADNTAGCGPLGVQFSNTSTPDNLTYIWDFGDGQPVSNDASPLHVFQPDPGGKDMVYTVKLTVQSDCAPASFATSDITVHPAVPAATFIPDQTEGCSPFVVTLTNTSPGTNLSYTYYLYDDAGNLVQKQTVQTKDQLALNPITTNKTRVYTLYMEAVGLCNNVGKSLERLITVSASVVTADMFIGGNKNNGCAPFTTTFVNNSAGGDVFYYEIYDSHLKPLNRVAAGTGSLPYTFTTPGLYYVSITASSSCSSGVESDPTRNSITVSQVPVAGFNAPVTTGCKNLAVTFTNTTATDPTAQPVSYSYQWDFGDGSAPSNGFNNVQHSYSYTGSPYTVTLIATNPLTGCSDTIKKTDYIVVNPPPGTDFTARPDTITSIPNYHFAFIDETTGNPANWFWDFGDGQTDNGKNPGHTYADTGIYKVTLRTVTSAGCDSTIVHHVRITGVPGELYLPNAFMPTSATTELQKFAAKGSGIKKWHLQVFNNYGQLIWETTRLDELKGTPVEGWDGTYKGQPVQQGVYIWQATATFINGTEWKGMTYNKAVPKRTGVINLIR